MDAKLLPAILMGVLSFACLALFFKGLRVALEKTGWEAERRSKILSRSIGVVIVWVALISLLAIRGFFSDFTALPPRPALLIILPIPFLIWIALSGKGTELLRAVPPHWLVAMQSFRILVEVLLWLAFSRNLLPVQMTFEGNNFDIVSGILAIPFAIALKKKWSPKIALAYNLVGIILLVNILVIAVLSMPTPLRKFTNQPANTLVGEFPFVFLPAILVVLAIALHIFSLRQVWIREKPRSVVF